MTRTHTFWTSLALAAGMGASLWLFGDAGTWLYSLGLGGALVALAVIDLRTFTLPDALNGAVLLLGA